MKKLLLSSAAVAVVFTQASAEPKFLATFKQHYKLEAGGLLDRSGCAICHAGPPKRNLYGKAIENALDLELTAQVLQSVEKADSDQDGVSNGDEIAAGTLPGDPASKPIAGAATQTTASPLIPTHTFHPALVHFPIALFVFGALLQVGGLVRKEEFLHKAGRICLLGGTASILLAIPTGVIAALRLGYGIGSASQAFVHLLIAVAASVVMTLTCVVGKTRADKLYWALLLVGSGLVGLAGHFGGLLVFGG